MRRSVPLEDAELAREVLGPRDRNLRRVREAMGVTAVLRGEKLILDGPHDQVERAAAAMAEICRVARTLGCISKDEVERIVEGAAGAPLQEDAPACAEARGGTPAPGPSTRQARLPVGRGREVEARTAGQAYYIDMMRGHDIVFSVGPAGTGKTYLAVAMALSELCAGRVNRICLARPAVEAGEKLGFLPGDLNQKVHPYLRPLYDALTDMMSISALSRLMDQGVVEVVPLAYMRGRTLGHAFVILDEAQNTTSAQMLMFLTRLGLESRAVVTGDVTQVDLPTPEESGLLQAVRILDGVEGIGIVHLSERDIVRHRLVREIVARWARLSSAPRPPMGEQAGALGGVGGQPVAGNGVPERRTPGDGVE